MLINGQHALGASDWQGGGEARGVGADGGWGWGWKISSASDS